MKTSILLMVIGLFIFSGCKKTYYCECTGTIYNLAWKEEVKAFDSSQAQAECAALSDSFTICGLYY